MNQGVDMLTNSALDTLGEDLPTLFKFYNYIELSFFLFSFFWWGISICSWLVIFITFRLLGFLTIRQRYKT